MTESGALLRLAACWWMLAKASRACNASRPLFSPSSASAGSVSGGTVQVVTAVVALFGVALISDYESSFVGSASPDV